MKKLVEVKIANFAILNGELYIKIEVNIPKRTSRSKWLNYSTNKQISSKECGELGLD